MNGYISAAQVLWPTAEKPVACSRERKRSREFVTVFAPATPPIVHREAVGPNSNTGLNLPSEVTSQPAANSSPFALGIDFCTLVFPESQLAPHDLFTPADAVAWLFPDAALTVGELQPKRWQFYCESAQILGPDGKLVGRFGIGSNGDTVCISLSGAGCALVHDWFTTVVQARRVYAHLSRVDVAFDDFTAQRFRDIREVESWALEGRFDARVGRPCDHHFLDDHGKRKGSTLYVGSRGRKQLCIYEKGKQLGDKASPWIRCELRLWANDSVLPLDVLVKPIEYLRGSYELLAGLLPHEADTCKPERIARTVSASMVAGLQFLHTQCGPLLDLLVRSVGPDVWHLLENRVFRSTVPRRFKGVAESLPALRAIVREQLGYLAAPTHLAV